jgi:hypothetical protein
MAVRLTAPANETERFLSAAVLNGNPFLKGTAGQARAAIARASATAGARCPGRGGDRPGAQGAGQKELEQQAAFDSERDRLNGQLSTRSARSQELRRRGAVRARAGPGRSRRRSDQDRQQPRRGEIWRGDQRAREDARPAAPAGQRPAGDAAHRGDPNPPLPRAAGRAAEDRRPGIRLPHRCAAVPRGQCEDGVRERAALELKIIDAQYEQLKYDLEIAKSKAIEAKNWDEAARLEAQLADLPNQKAREPGGRRPGHAGTARQLSERPSAHATRSTSSFQRDRGQRPRARRRCPRRVPARLEERARRRDPGARRHRRAADQARARRAARQAVQAEQATKAGAKALDSPLPAPRSTSPARTLNTAGVSLTARPRSGKPSRFSSRRRRGARGRRRGECRW